VPSRSCSISHWSTGELTCDQGKKLGVGFFRGNGEGCGSFAVSN